MYYGLTYNLVLDLMIGLLIVIQIMILYSDVKKLKKENKKLERWIHEINENLNDDGL